MALFTPETAVEFARKSWAPESARFLPKPPPPPPPVPPTNPALLPHDEFVCEMLITIRERMRECLDRMKGARTGCEKQAVALGKLAEIERQLAGRPMPGSLKPAAAKPSRRELIAHSMPDPDAGQLDGAAVPPADLLARPATD